MLSLKASDKYLEKVSTSKSFFFGEDGNCINIYYLKVEKEKYTVACFNNFYNMHYMGSLQKKSFKALKYSTIGL